jgi:hypothetical protein
MRASYNLLQLALLFLDRERIETLLKRTQTDNETLSYVFFHYFYFEL